MNNTVPKTEMVRIALTGEMIKYISDKAKENNTSISNVVRTCIDKAMREK